MVASIEDQVLFETAASTWLARCRSQRRQTPSAPSGAGLDGRRFDTATAVAVCDQGRLVGLLSMENLLAASEEASAAEAMDPDPPMVGPGLDQERAAWARRPEW